MEKSLNSTQNRELSKLQTHFSEKEILHLQKVFLHNGFNKIQNNTSITKHDLVNIILTSLNYYKNIVYISDNINNDEQNIFGYINDRCSLEIDKNLIAFFLDEFNYDFLWIDETKGLKSTNWYDKFLKYIEEFNFNRVMPIIII